MRISLIVTTYNRPDALLLVLKTIQNQRVKPFEVIIADDGSDDLTKKVVDDFSLTTELNIIHSFQEDDGFRVSESRNKAISIANGEYIILVDGDMLLHSEFVNDHAENAQNGFYIQGSRVLMSSIKTLEVLKTKKIIFNFFEMGLKNRLNSIHSSFLSNIFTTHSNQLKGVRTCNMSFFKKNCIEVNGFNTAFKGWGREDSEFVARLFNYGINRKTIKFAAVQYHLWHKESNRKLLNHNDQLLHKAIHENLKWCKHGINQFL